MKKIPKQKEQKIEVRAYLGGTETTGNSRIKGTKEIQNERHEKVLHEDRLKEKIRELLK